MNLAYKVSKANVIVAGQVEDIRLNKQSGGKEVGILVQEVIKSMISPEFPKKISVRLPAEASLLESGIFLLDMAFGPEPCFEPAHDTLPNAARTSIRLSLPPKCDELLDEKRLREDFPRLFRPKKIGGTEPGIFWLESRAGKVVAYTCFNCGGIVPGAPTHENQPSKLLVQHQCRYCAFFIARFVYYA